MDSNETETYVNDFEKMNLSDNLLRGIYAYGFEKPSEIQSKAIIPIIKKRDIIAQSQSGTGKTGAFTIGTLQLIDENTDGLQAIIIAPIRELAVQINDVCSNLGQFLKKKPVLCVGGSNIQDCRRDLNKGSIVIGCPGRIIDMMEKGYLVTKNIKVLVLDEADELLSNSFVKQIRLIVEQLPSKTQICLFSATMPPSVVELSKKFMNNPETIFVKPEQLTLEGIKQFYIDIKYENWKFDTFCDLYNVISISQSIVYVNTKKKAEWLSVNLIKKNFTVSIIRGDMEASERTAIMKDFRSGNTRILISTDLLSRGIDIQQVSVVINYDLPNNNECYIHRIGRSGRFGRKGVAINFATTRDLWRIKELEEFYSTAIEDMPDNINDFI